jgi:hypothetical protein
VELSSVAHLINPSRRLMPKALRIGGWSHSISHTMETVCKVFSSWPSHLRSIRTLCNTLRNGSYRRHIARKLASVVVGASGLLKNFTANVAKWRFETLSECARQLVKVREICEQLERSNFDGVADECEMADFITACKNKAFWRFIAVLYCYLLNPLEGFRRWGLLCPCHEAERHRDRGEAKKFRHCIWNSRRLRQVPAKIAEVLASMKDQAGRVTVQDCEGDAQLQSELVNAIRVGSVDLDTRTKYHGSLPWAFSRGDTQEGARKVIELYRSLPPDQHDALTVDTFRDFGDDIRKLADNGFCSKA